MNLQQLKKSVGHKVQLQPIARVMDGSGHELQAPDDDWLIEDVRNDYVQLRNLRTADVVKLGKDHIHHYSSNPQRSTGEAKYGSLILNVQIVLEAGKNPRYRENFRMDVSPVLLTILQELRRNSGYWCGAPMLFNKFAAEAIYGPDFSELMSPHIDYYSVLIAGGYVEISSVTDSGDKPDGTADVTVILKITQKGYRA